MNRSSCDCNGGGGDGDFRVEDEGTGAEVWVTGGRGDPFSFERSKRC